MATGARSSQGIGERRRAPRTGLDLTCTLRRRTGSPIACRTVELGPGGMSVCSGRPLAPDEVLAFELPVGEAPLTGRARVLRQQTHEVYALRFEQLAAPVRAELEQIVARG